MSKKPVVVFVSFQIKPGMEEAFKKEVTAMTEQVIHEPECLNINLYQAMDDLTKFMLYETWLDRDYFVNVQLQKPYYEPYLEKTMPMWLEPRGFAYWEMLSEQLGAGYSAKS